MTVTAKSNDGKVECHYDSKEDKDKVELTIQASDGCLVFIKVDRDELPELIKTLTYFDELLRLTTGR